ncbi:type III polyketide synthase [Pseudoclavibacter helvolus]|uniref:type III polyketide synthase n=1 Tax=Pseudoclavibacter helvolus TaxID=255205 RepID=UPI003C71A8B5
MSVHIRSIGTAVPPTVLPQTDARDLFAGQPGINRLGARLIGAAFDGSAIERRHTVVDALAGGADSALVADGRVLDASTGARNEVYAARVPELLLGAARAALAGSDLEASDITHVVTVSCTGFYAPGPDYEIVRGLGLSPRVQRFHLGFMGCYGAFPALRAADAFARADPDAVVLIVCVELCTIHLTSSNDPEQIVATSVFADGAAAALVTARPAPAGTSILSIDALESTITDEGESEMAWTIGDSGFRMRLSGYVPSIIGASIEDVVAPLLAPTVPARTPLWAIHPGGRSILDKVEHALGLTEEQLAASRGVLRDYGNMSSATVLFILERFLAEGGARAGGAQNASGSGGVPGAERSQRSQGSQPSGDPAGSAAKPPEDAGEALCAMAFGPGLTVEVGRFTRMRA